MATSGFTETQPVAYAHEELIWQGELARAGHRIWFEPFAVVLHRNRPGLGQLLRRNYRWGYSSIQAKAGSGSARFQSLYRHPWLIVLASVPLAFLTTVHVIWSWAKVGRFEPLLMAPLVFAARVAWSAGLAKGGLRWMGARSAPESEYRPRWE